MKNKPGRNDLCPCNSGKKYKKCCGKSAIKDHTATQISSDSGMSNNLLGKISQIGASFKSNEEKDKKINASSIKGDNKDFKK